MPIAVEHDDRQILHATVLRTCDALEVLGNAGGDVDDLCGRGPDDELLHVVEVAVEHGPALRERHGGDPARDAAGDEAGAVDRVDGDVYLRRVAVADLLTDVEHRRLVLLALADDHDTVHVDESKAAPHGVDGGLVGRFLLVAPHVARG